MEIDVAGKSIGEVLEWSINIIETTPSCFDYEYEKPPKEMFYSWVFANGLRWIPVWHTGKSGVVGVFECDRIGS